MKATKLIRDKGLKYAKEIVDSAPDNATEWNEGYEFQCGQSVEISKADREKYFVDLSELKRLVESLDRIDKCGGLYGFKTYCNGDYSQEDLQAIRDHESIYGAGDETN
ncbi:hypothetical protein KNV99_00135 [Acinetobacter nosocomialis]|nr:hypothetical protein KNV99_19300 [Acinetobacter nosocomialis]WDM39888.1 hypothetical protein KNV99_00135 [Acinetobacter nosocomialis]